VQAGSTEFASFYKKKLNFFKWYTLVDFTCGSTATYFNVYWYSINNVSISQIFLLNFIGMAVAMVFQNIGSFVSDRLNRRYPLLIAALVTQGVSVLVSAWFPTFIGFVLYIIIWFSFSGESQRTLVQYALIKLAKDPSMPLEKLDLSKEFSRYRIFGSIGTCISLPLWGWFIETGNTSLGLDPVNGSVGYQLQFSMCGIAFFLLAVLLVVAMQDYVHREPEYLRMIDTGSAKTMNGTRAIDLLKNLRFLAIIIPQMIFMVGFSIGTNVRDVFFKDIGANLVFIGFISSISAFAELPLFFVSSKLARGKGGTTTALFVSYVFFAVKLFIYAFFMNGSLLGLALALESLSVFGIRWPAVTEALQNITATHKSLALTILLTAENSFTLLGSFLGAVISSTISPNSEAFRVLFITGLLLTCAAAISIVILHGAATRGTIHKRPESLFA
jgi:hypothetical protein